MKRRITVDQLMELTTNQSDILRDLWKPQTGDIYYSDIFGSPDENVWNMFDSKNEYLMPLLDIGQMIELLESKVGQVQMSVARPDLQYVDFWHNDDEQNFNNKELCDALWEAVKSVLII